MNDEEGYDGNDSISNQVPVERDAQIFEERNGQQARRVLNSLAHKGHDLDTKW
ncbi:MAG: hypothetical protein ACPGWR_12300 [Ardenticatenaceae bacterium]